MITGQDIISLAARWAALDAGEATWRSSVSRAYYGAFHCAYELLRELGIPDPVSMENRHLFVQQALLASGNPDAQMAGSLLGSLHEARKAADYNLASREAGKQQFARDKVKNAMDIRGFLAKCNDVAARHTMSEQIIAWKQRVRK